MVVLPILLLLFCSQRRYESSLFEARAILTEASRHIEARLSHDAVFSQEESDFMIDCEIALATHKLIGSGFLHLSSGTERQVAESVEAMRDMLLSIEGSRLVHDKIEAIRRQLSSVDTSFAANLIQHMLWRDSCGYCAAIAAIVE